MSSLEDIVKSTTGETRELLEQLVHQLANSVNEKRRLEQTIEYLTHDVRALKKRLFGTSSEQQKNLEAPSQAEVNLFDEFYLCEQVIELDVKPESTSETETALTKSTGRKPLPKSLPRKIIEHDLSPEEKICACGHEMEYIGAVVSEQLDYQPAKMTVIENRCKKYGCLHCNQASKSDPSIPAQLKTATKPPQIIPKGIATPSLLAQIAIQKYCDHLPLYRQEIIFKRLSIQLSRQTMSDWMIKVGDAIIPLINLMQEHILDYDVSFADETPLQVLNEPGRRAQTKSYMWCFLGGPPNKKAIIYQYHETRSSSVPEQFFDGYQGALHCDGYSGYTKLISSENMVGVNCMAHVRRRFIDALPNGKLKGVSGTVVQMLQKLYKIEASLKSINASQDTIKSTRQENAKPILNTLKLYLEEKASGVPPKSNLGKAISYTLKRWPYLITYLEDGRYEIDNNTSERAIKPFVMGRKAWLFSNSQQGAHSSARIFSLIESAKANELEPAQYLQFIFERLPYCKTLEDYEALLPWNVKSVLCENIVSMI